MVQYVPKTWIGRQPAAPYRDIIGWLRPHAMHRDVLCALSPFLTGRRPFP